MKLENLVPDISLCKQIPEGKFEDSAMVWTQGVDGMFIDFRDARPEDEEGNLPAPTLQEIMEALFAQDEEGRNNVTVERQDVWLHGWGVSTWVVVYQFAQRDAKNPSAAALRLWLGADFVKRCRAEQKRTPTQAELEEFLARTGVTARTADQRVRFHDGGRE